MLLCSSGDGRQERTKTARDAGQSWKDHREVVARWGFEIGTQMTGHLKSSQTVRTRRKNCLETLPDVPIVLPRLLISVVQA